jgi:Histidine phosphatase superfamily (branch 1)
VVANVAGSRCEALLVRHAHAPWSPDESGGLSPEGRLAAERLAGILAAERIDAIYSSPYSRARETVDPLARRLSLAIHEIADLRERHLGGGAFDDFRAAVRATWDDFSFAHPGGETNAAAQRRVVDPPPLRGRGAGTRDRDGATARRGTGCPSHLSTETSPRAFRKGGRSARGANPWRTGRTSLSSDRRHR